MTRKYNIDAAYYAEHADVVLNSVQLDHYCIYPKSPVYGTRVPDYLVQVDRHFHGLCKSAGKMTQHWIFMDLDTMRNDAVFIHSRNRMTEYPRVFAQGNLSRLYDGNARRLIKRFSALNYMCFKHVGIRCLIAFHKSEQFSNLTLAT